MAIAVAMGANTVRLTSCGVSVGSQYGVEPSNGTFAASGSAQVRKIIPSVVELD